MRSTHRADELLKKMEMLDMELYLDQRGLDYRLTTGSSGEQINVRECPRCGGTGWKVYLNRESGLGNCFHGSCVGEPGFNKFSFIKAINEGSGSKTMKEIDLFLRDLGWRPKKIPKTYKQQSAYFNLPDSEEISEGGAAFKYLFRRGFDLLDIEYFNWSFCREGWFVYNQDGRDRYQAYNGRVLIPIYDENGNLQTFQGRDVTGLAEKKYLFPPGLPGSGRFLYNANNCLGKKIVILNEGVMDVAWTSKHLETRSVGSVGTFGKSLSHGDFREGRDQLGILYKLQKMGMKETVIMWDGEHKTIKDALKVARDLENAGLPTTVVRLDHDKDPNETSPDDLTDAFLSRTKPSIKDMISFSIRG